MQRFSHLKCREKDCESNVQVYGRVQRDGMLKFSHLKCTEKECEPNVQSLWTSTKKCYATFFSFEVHGKGLWIKCTKSMDEYKEIRCNGFPNGPHQGVGWMVVGRIQSVCTSTKGWHAKVFSPDVLGKWNVIIKMIQCGWCSNFPDFIWLMSQESPKWKMAPHWPNTTWMFEVVCTTPRIMIGR